MRQFDILKPETLSNLISLAIFVSLLTGDKPSNQNTVYANHNLHSGIPGTFPVHSRYIMPGNPQSGTMLPVHSETSIRPDSIVSLSPELRRLTADLRR